MTSASTPANGTAVGRSGVRLLYAFGGLAAIIGTVVVAGRGDWRAVTAAIVLAIAPDIPLFFGFDASGALAKGQLHPRAVPAYNAAHRLVGPAAVLAVAGGLGFWVSAGAALTAGAAGLAWLAHVLVDRACGYNLRTPDGFRR
jgi:Domain of unknown function (DUF4260)